MSRPGRWAPLQLALAVGIFVGLLEALVHLIERLALGRVVHVSREVLWMAPVANLLWFGLAGALLALGASRFPGRVTPATVVGGIMALGFLNLTLLCSRLHPAAAALLSTGLGVQCGRRLAPHIASERWNIARTLVAACLAVLIIGATQAGWRAHEERVRIVRLPPSRERVPNIVLLVLDTVRGFSMSLYGYHRSTTPNLERWAHRGVVFERAFATAPWTLPSHASMFTGRFGHELNAGLTVPLDATYPTLAEILGRAGYRTAGFAANLPYCSYEHGLDRGFQHYEDYDRSPGTVLFSQVFGRDLLRLAWFRNVLDYYDEPWGKSAAEVNQAFLDWQLELPAGRPFFAFLNYFDVHSPYRPPAPFDTAFGADPDRHWRQGDMVFGRLTIAEISTEQRSYDAAIRYLDDQVDALLTSLESRGALENTIVVITSDHGEQWGEHQLLSHVNSVYRQLLQVPLLIIASRRIPEGVRIERPVSLASLPRTVLLLAGVPGEVPGHALFGPASLRSADPVLAEVTDLGGKRQRSAIRDGWHYILNHRGVEELYWLETDPAEVQDLADDPGMRSVLARFRVLLDSVDQHRLGDHPMDTSR